ncbi:MAG TPA: CehA/McbA family metallohydrolase [Chloroflexota bacterium]|nr:CehA/McbA family metallohydrolase [Chloroflexota bacterium]
MQRLPFDQPGRFYKGNLHTHSTRSDGRASPSEVIATYRDNGYDFLALTDHFLERFNYPIVDTREFRTDTFTTLLGAELHAPKTELGERWHIVGAGLPLDFAPPTPEETGPQLAARARDAGAFVGMAHPSWYGLTMNDALSLEAAHAVEVFNETCAGDNDRGDSWPMLDALLAMGHRLNAYAADDAHFYARPDVRRSWVMVRAESLDPEALLTALKDGQYYSSRGPEIRNLAIENGKLRLECSPVAAIFVGGVGPKCRYIHGEGLTSATFELSPFAGKHCRVTVADAQGHRAWTNPIWLDS